MIIGSVLKEAEEAVGLWRMWHGEWAGFLHSCVDGSHQWCHEWEGEAHVYRIDAVIETYMVLLEDYRNNLVEKAYYDQYARELREEVNSEHEQHNYVR